MEWILMRMAPILFVSLLAIFIAIGVLVAAGGLEAEPGREAEPQRATEPEHGSTAWCDTVCRTHGPGFSPYGCVCGGGW